MKLSLSLALALISLAALVGVVGYLSSGALEGTVTDLEAMRRSSLEEVKGATAMLLALEESQRAAQELIAERYRSRFEAAHDSEWGIAEDIEVEPIEESLNRFGEHLEASRRLAPTDPEQEERLGAIGREFAVHRSMVNRLVHLARLHPSDQVSEYVADELRPHYRTRMFPLIGEYETRAQESLDRNVAQIEASLGEARRRNRNITLAAFAAALLFAVWMAIAITRPLDRLREAASRVGRGDLRQAVPVTSHNEIGVVSEAFNQMMASLREITVSRTQLDDIIQSIGEMLLVTDEEGEIRAFNRVAAAELGFAEEELSGRRIESVIEIDGAPELETTTALLGRGVARRANGSELAVFCTSSPLRNPDGEASGRVWVARNIQTELESERQLESSLTEKEILLKEVHHRVKNNLQVISSLLSLQGREDDETAHLLRDCQNRILSMAILHEQLYRSEDLARIDFADYAGRLVDRIARSHGRKGTQVRMHVAVGRASLSLDEAVPCGMVLTELVSNAIEHAFPQGTGEIWIDFEIDNGAHRLRVRDDGIGLPAGLDPASADSLGLKLVAALAEQLEGELSWSVEEGTEFSFVYAAA